MRRLIEKEADKLKAKSLASGVSDDEHAADVARGKIRAVNSFKAVCSLEFSVDIKLHKYGLNSALCRHAQICQYFGETLDFGGKDGQAPFCERMCDVRPSLGRSNARSAPTEV
jgi:hypothetical protein